MGPKYGKMLGGIKAALDQLDGNAAMDELKANGFIAFEIGYNQGESVFNILEENNFKNIIIEKDMMGLDRVIYGQLSSL